MTDALHRLYDKVLAEKGQEASHSRTAKLFADGRTKIAKKVAEEAVEVGLDFVLGNRDAAIRESADLLYNLCVVWAEAGIRPEDVWAEMESRETRFGIAAKLPKVAQHEVLEAARKALSAR